jgi:hypothetical protein
MVWAVMAVLVLYSMAEKVSFKHATIDVEYGWWQVFMMPYNLDVDCVYEWNLRWKFSVFPFFQRKRTPISAGPEPPSVSTDKYSIRVVAKMPDNSWIASWEHYIFIIEVFAIVIYFYATVVLLSVVFMRGVSSVKFAAWVSLLYLVLRVTESLI